MYMYSHINRFTKGDYHIYNIIKKLKHVGIFIDNII